MKNCNGNCDQGRQCDCCESCQPTGMTIVLGAAVLYGVICGAALTVIFQKIVGLL